MNQLRGLGLELIGHKMRYDQATITVTGDPKLPHLRDVSSGVVVAKCSSRVKVAGVIGASEAACLCVCLVLGFSGCLHCTEAWPI